MIPTYLLFGDADQLSAKVAQGSIKDWRPENAIGQLRLAGMWCANMGLTDLTTAKAAGAQTLLVIGVANRGGVIQPGVERRLDQALSVRASIASGLHNLLGDEADHG
jgi:uncharacterized NAD-dependent epimerase/dehydratase family protein